MWYLLLLVVDPLVQRAGLGTRLQAPVLEVADREGVDCYLETQKPENLAYYRRFGYEVGEELRPVAGRPSAVDHAPPTGRRLALTVWAAYWRCIL